MGIVEEYINESPTKRDAKLAVNTSLPLRMKKYSETKANPNSTPEDIKKAGDRVEHAAKLKGLLKGDFWDGEKLDKNIENSLKSNIAYRDKNENENVYNTFKNYVTGKGKQIDGDVIPAKERGRIKELKAKGQDPIVVTKNTQKHSKDAVQAHNLLQAVRTMKKKEPSDTAYPETKAPVKPDSHSTFLGKPNEAGYGHRGSKAIMHAPSGEYQNRYYR